MQVRDLLLHAESRLRPVSESPRLDAEVLLAFVLGRERSWLRAFGETEPDQQQQARFEALLQRREAGEPVAYLLGRREFWSLSLTVTPDTLIPRPDTELLVECAIGSLPGGGRLLDLGTGSGAIALAVRCSRRDARVVAVDRSQAALEVARQNGVALGLQVEWYLSDWFSALPAGVFDVIVSNPPYIAEGDPHLHAGDVAHEPRTALVSGGGGLEDLRLIIAETPNRLAEGGWLWLEHGFAQAAAVRALLGASGFVAIETRRDLSGHERVTGGRFGG
jgi:release factor glutamine methyltransferase